MIYATVNVTIGEYESVCDKLITLYRGDKNVEIRFVMHGNRFTVLDNTYAQMIIKRPSAASIFSAPALIQNDTVVFLITDDMIDELKEIGAYTFQIRLYDDNMVARVTLPPCYSTLFIEKPIAVEGESIVNLAMVNDSAVMLADATISEEDIFTEDGQYNKTMWKDGDLITDVKLNKIEEALHYINENGGGGGGATAPYISSELPENIIVPSGNNFDLPIDYYSPNFGKGTLKVFINDIESVSKSIEQGVSTTIIDGDKFSKGTNRVVVYVIDRVGVMSNSLVFYLRYGSTEITSDFDPYSAYDYGSIIRYYFTPTSVDTSLSLSFYMSIDGTVQKPVSCKSDVRGYFTFPMNLSAGKHYCEAYVIDSENTKSNVLKFNLIILQNNTLVVASDTADTTIEEGAQLTLDYKVYMKNNSSFITEVYVDNNLVNTGTCGLDFNEYKTSSLTEGTHSIKLVVYDVTRRYRDSIIWTVVVTASAYEMLQPVNAGAIFIGTAVNKSNTDERRQYFIGHDQEGNEILGTLTNFAFNSESGWVDDELIISGNSYAEIPIQPLANNAKYGFTLDIEFTSKQIGVPDAEVLTLWNYETNCGIRITTEKLILQSSNGNKCDLYFTDNEKTHVMFIIDRQELKAKIYLNGVMCEAFHLNDYTVDGVAYLDDFTVNSNIVLGGLNKNGYSKIRNLRVYQVALTTDEIINNFISCEIDKAKQRELSEFQKGNDLPTLYVYCDFSGLGKDDKKPCKIVYNSTNEELYGKSFNLDHKQSQLQYQGTSSMAYPIKNYRLNLRDENGDKWYYTLPTAQPECRFTLKADFMSSGHWTNTGMAKFINDKLYNYNVNDEKSMNPFKWNHVQNGGKVNDFRETITGFPCRLILVNDGETPLNTGQNEPTPGNTKDMGIFNFNNDKDNVTTLGFNSDIFPNCASYEVTANSDTSAGAFMSYKATEYNIGLVGGGYTTLIPANVFYSRELTFDDVLSGTIFEYDINGEIINRTVVYKDSTLTLNEDTIKIRFTTELLNNATYGVVSGIKFNITLGGFEEMNTSTPSHYEPVGDEADELAYLKESFELRHPDADDVAEDWGFMGVETEKPVHVIDYALMDPNIKLTTVIEKPESISVGTASNCQFFFVYFKNGAWTNNSGNFGGTSAIDLTGRSETHVAIGLRGGQSEEYIIINGIKYLFGNEVALDTFKDPYLSETVFETAFDTSYGLKALIDWVDNCTDEEFVADFEEHFHKDYTLRYFCLVTLIGAVDNLGKNMMLDTADHKIFFPRFYDIDTICSYDNSGQLKFDVDIEMEQGYWNTSSSRLWTRIRDLMHDDIVATYNNMRQNGVSYENMMHYIYDEQIAKIPQTYYNKDYDVKYAPFADSYIGMAHGDTYEHVKRWLKQRFTFVDTLFDYAPSYNNDILTIRVNTTEEITLHLETYTPVYQHLSWYNGQMDKKKIDGKTSITFSGKVQAATDQEVLIYGGSNIKKISGIQSGNPNRLILGSATKLTELDASNCPLLYEINMNKANLSPHEYLNKVNLSNCPLLEGNLRLNNSPLIQELDIRGTNITGMNLPSSIRNLQILKLPNTMTELTLNDAGMLHTLEFDEGVKMQSIAMTNCNALINVVNFDLLQTPSITLNNSYNTAAELYFRDTTNLSLSNMSNLERVIFTPNNEYETFELINVANAPDYKVTTFNCPKLSTFMTTAPYRESYNNVSKYVDKEIEVLGDVTLTENYSPKGVSFKYDHIVIDFKKDGYIEVEVDLSTCINKLENIISFGLGINLWTGGSNQIHMHYDMLSACMAVYDAVNNKSINIPVTGIAIIRLDASGVYINGTKCCENSLIGLIFISIGSQEGSVRSNAIYNYIKYSGYHSVIVQAKDYGGIQPNTTFTANSIDISNTQFTDVKLLCTTDTNTLKLPTTVKNFYCDSSFDLDTYWLEDGEYDVVHGELVEPYTTDYEGEVLKTVERNIALISDGLFSEHLTDGQRLDSNWIIVNAADNSVTDKIPARGSITVTSSRNVGFRMFVYDENDNILTDYSFNWSTTLLAGSTTFDISDNARYIIASFGIGVSGAEMYKSNLTLTAGSKDAPNLIPSSADGSLIFSMYAPSNTVAPASGTWDLRGLEFDNFHTFGMNNDVFMIDEIKSITMPARYDDYNITIKNAHISPKTHNTMLYPLLVNEDNPITGTLDYTNYAGKHLSWSFAYTDEEYVNIIQPKYELINSYKYRYNAFYDTEFEFVNPYEVARYTSSSSGVLPTFNKEFVGYTTGETDNGDGTYTVSITTDSLDNLPTSISFYGRTTLLTVDKLNTSNITSMYAMFHNCNNLTSLDTSGFDTTNVDNMSYMFQNCSKLTSLDLSGFDTGKVTNMNSIFAGCKALTELVGLSDWDTSAVTDISYAFQSLTFTNLDLGGWDLTNCKAARDAWNFMYSLRSIVFPNNLSVSFGIGQSFDLTADNVVDIFNKLATVTTTQTATIGANLLKKLTEDQIAIATNKGWTVA